MSDICLVTTIAGTMNVMYEGQLEYLRDRGHELTLITGGEESEIERLRLRRVGKVVVMPLVRPPRPLADLKALFRLMSYFAKHKHDTVIVTTPKAILLGAVATFVTRQPRRVVFFQGRVYENFKGCRRLFYKFLDRVAAWCAHEVVFVSPSLMEVYARDAKIFRERGLVVGRGSINGVNTDKFNPEHFEVKRNNEIREKLRIEDDQYIVVVIGRICRDKGIAELDVISKRALESGARLVFVFIGWIEDNAAELFQKMEERENIRYAGVTRHVEDYLAIADIHLFLTYREGFGNVAIEAAAMGVPTIAFDVVGVKDSVAHGVSGIRVKFADVDAVWRAIAELLTLNGCGRNRYPEARKWAGDIFEQHKVWRNYEKFYGV